MREVTGPPRDVSEPPDSGPLEHHTAKGVSCTQPTSCLEPPSTLMTLCQGRHSPVRPGQARPLPGSFLVLQKHSPRAELLVFPGFVFSLVT